MQILVHTSHDGNFLVLKVESTDTVSSLKAKIQEKTKISAAMQRLTLDIYEELEESQKLQDYKIQENSIISCHLRLIPRDFMAVHVMKSTTRPGSEIVLKAEPSDSIEKIKKEIQVKDGISVDKQLLLVDERVLEDSRTLRYYDIKDGSSIRLQSNSKRFRQENQMFQVFYRGLDNRTKTLDVSADEKIESVKMKIQRKENVDAALRLRTMVGRLLEDDRTLAHYNIGKENTIQVSVTLPNIGNITL
jgi:predicted RNase H-related nuclease YkuK (DUF458 family)